jgi:outer membrane protein OmpA-like peptidoglycan-associated protein
MRHLSILILAILTSWNIATAQAKKTSTPSKTSTKATSTKEAATKAPVETTTPSTADKSDNLNGVDLFKNDKAQKDYNYEDRKKISKPLMPSYEYMQPFHEPGKKRKAQQEAYLANKYYYTARPKNKWEIGIGVGNSILVGDLNFHVNDIMGNSGFHIETRKALSYFFSLRGMYAYQTTTGRKVLPDYQVAGLYATTSGVGGPDLRNVNYGNLIPYVQTYYHNLNLDIILTLGNTRFHKERSKSNFDIFFGLGAMAYRSKQNVLDANGKGYLHHIVDSLINTAAQNYPNSPTPYVDAKSSINSALDAEFDNTFESRTDINPDHVNILGYGVALPNISFGAGYNYRISKLFSLGIMSRATLPNTDYIDGYIYNGNAEIINGRAVGKISAGNDILMYNALNFAYNIGGKKAIEPLYWQNPIHHTNMRMGAADPAKAIEDAFKDDDEDGVPNQLDKEAATKKGLPVDVQGRALDSDKDGLKDGDDKEPFSPPGLPIDENGVAIVPPPACCAMMDSLGRMKGMGGNGNNGGGNSCGEVTLPSLSYNTDHYGAQRNDFVPILHIVGEKLQLCPDAKIVVSGVNDKVNKNGKYNEQLSYNRANEVINYLTEKYGISRDRFIMKFNQEGTGNSAKDKRVDFKFAKDGETGESNPPAPHPGLKAGSNQ